MEENPTLKHHNRRRHFIKKLPSGGYRIDFAPSRGMKSSYIPNPEHFKAKIEKQNGEETESDKRHLMFFGLIFRGEVTLKAGRKSLGLQDLENNHVTKKEVHETLRKLWPLKECRAYLNRGEGKLISMAHFIKKHQRVYHALSRNSLFKGVEHTLNRYFPGLYETVTGRLDSKFHKRADREKIREEIKRAFASGSILSSAGLCLSPNPSERKLGCKIKILLLEKNKGLGKEDRHSFTGYAAKLGGLDIKETILTTKARIRMAIAAERLTEFYLVWAGLAECNPLHVELGAVSRDYGRTKFAYGEKAGRADLRVNNHAIEVKTGVHSLDERVAEDISAKYASGNTVWVDNRMQLEGATLFMQQQLNLYKNSLDGLRSAGINIISYTEFHYALKDLVKRLKKSGYAPEFEDVSPRGDLEAVVFLHSQLGNARVYGRGGHARLWKWGIEYLNALIEQGKIRQEGVLNIDYNGGSNENEPF